MESKQGCPDESVNWLEGWRYQDTEDDRPSSSYSSDITNYMNGEFGVNNNIMTFFCIKNRYSYTASDKLWSPGAYCLLKYGACPQGFVEGFIYWDDEDDNNRNGRGGTLPDGNYDKNTRIYYCCRNDGSPNYPIFLPTERPFILVRYGNTCQAVHGMNVKDLYIRWDDEDVGNEDSRGGMHPSDDEGSNNHLLHFCYYYAVYNNPIFG